MNALRQGGRLALAACLGMAAQAWADPLGYGADMLAEAPIDADRNADGVPDGWVVVREAGFRSYPGSSAIEDRPKGEEAGPALRLFMNGRSVGVETAGGAQVQAGSAYRLEGRVRARGLRAGTPEAELRWLGPGGRPMGFVRRSLPRSQAWTGFRVEAGAVPEGASAVVVRLAARGDEVSGTAWFEDVHLFRAPGLALEGLGPGHLAPPGTAELAVALTGLDAGAYSLSASLADLSGAARWTWARDLELPQGAARVALGVPLVREGAFRLAVRLSSGGRTVADRETWLSAVSPLPPAGGGPSGGGPPAGMVGAWMVPDGTRAQAVLVDQLVPAAAAVEIWTPGYRLEGVTWGANPSDALLRRLVRRGVRCVGVLGEPPADAQPETALRATVLRYAGEIDAWALRMASKNGWEGMSSMWKGMEPWAAHLPHPSVWGVWPSAIPSGAPAPPPFSFALGTEAVIGTGAGGLEPWPSGDLPEDDGPAALRAFGIRAVRDALAGRHRFLRLDDRPGGLLAEDGAARPAFLLWRVLSQASRGARVEGEIPLDERVEAYALRQGAQTVILAWKREPGGGNVEIELAAVDPVTAVDAMGCPEVLASAGGQVRLEVGDLPGAFLAGASGWLTTRTSMRLDGDVLAARTATRRTLSFENGFERALAGTLRLSGPPGWRVEPASVNVSVPPGGRFSAGVKIVPAPFEVTGAEGRTKHLEAELQCSDGRLAPMRVAVPFRLRPSGITARASSRYEPAGAMVRITQEIVNAGPGSAVCDAFLSARGRREERRPLGRLAPEEIRQVLFEIPWRDLVEGDVVVGVRELEGDRRFAIEGLRGE